MLSSNCSKIATSEWQAPAPAIFSSTSPGPGVGRSTSSSVGKVFPCVKRTAFLWSSYRQRRGTFTAPRDDAALLADTNHAASTLTGSARNNATAQQTPSVLDALQDVNDDETHQHTVNQTNPQKSPEPRLVCQRCRDSGHWSG